MTTEQHLQKAQLLAQALADVDDNEVKKVYSFLCRQRQMSVMHELVKALPASPFKNRSKSTPQYYARMKDIIPQHLPPSMDVEEAIQIFGWACRLLKYEAAKREQRQPQQKTQPRGKPRKGGRRW